MSSAEIEADTAEVRASAANENRVNYSSDTRNSIIGIHDNGIWSDDSSVARTSSG